MTREDKDLVLKDLCGRLPYGVKCYIPEANDTSILGCIQEDGENTLFDFWEDSRKIQYWHQLYISEFKPYLFPLSKVVEEIMTTSNNHIAVNVDFFHKNHIDYRGLIDKGLAIDATDKDIY
jgi:hypothetical protein